MYQIGKLFPYLAQTSNRAPRTCVTRCSLNARSVILAAAWQCVVSKRRGWIPLDPQFLQNSWFHPYLLFQPNAGGENAYIRNDLLQLNPLFFTNHKGPIFILQKRRP